MGCARTFRIERNRVTKRFKRTTYVCCNYTPPGNLAGEFRNNVFPQILPDLNQLGGAVENVTEFASVEDYMAWCRDRDECSGITI